MNFTIDPYQRFSTSIHMNTFTWSLGVMLDLGWPWGFSHGLLAIAFWPWSVTLDGLLMSGVVTMPCSVFEDKLLLSSPEQRWRAETTAGRLQWKEFLWTREMKTGNSRKKSLRETHYVLARPTQPLFKRRIERKWGSGSVPCLFGTTENLQCRAKTLADLRCRVKYGRTTEAAGHNNASL